MDKETALVELGKRVRARREAMGFTIDAAAEASGISAVTWSRVELGRPVRGLSYGAVDQLLGWPPSSCKDFLETGKEPPKTVIASAHDSLTLTGRATASVTSAREVRQQKIALARQILRDAFDENEQPPAEDVDAYRLEERIARLRRLMAQRRDTASAAELDLMLKMYEEGEETG